jgi:hypothetical protein
LPFGRRTNRGIAAIAALATLLAGAFPIAAPADGVEAQQQLALNLFNTQSCAQHYADAPSTLAQASSAPQSTPTPAASPSPFATPGLPQVPNGVNNGTYTLNASPKPRPGQSPAVTPPPIPSPTPNPTISA